MLFLHKWRCQRIQQLGLGSSYNPKDGLLELNAKTFQAYRKSCTIVTACWWHVCHPSSFSHDPAVGSAHCVDAGGTKRPLGAGSRGCITGLITAEGPEGFPQEELACPSQVIKMEDCFDKDTLGHFFPTESGQRPAVRRHLKKTWCVSES